MGSSRALAALATALVLGGSPVAAPGADAPPHLEPTRAPLPGREYGAPAPAVDLAGDISALRDEVGALWHQLDRLSEGETAPRWATLEHDRLDRRLERVTTLLERLSARVDTPIPRLDEPLTLITVALCTLILGFLGGRSLRRRSNRRDLRFRL